MMTLILHTNFTDTDPNGDPDLGDDPDPNPDYDTDPDPYPYPDHDAIQNLGPERDPYPPLVWTPETDTRRLLSREISYRVIIGAITLTLIRPFLPTD